MKWESDSDGTWRLMDEKNECVACVEHEACKYVASVGGYEKRFNSLAMAQWYVAIEIVGVRLREALNKQINS